MIFQKNKTAAPPPPAHYPMGAHPLGDTCHFCIFSRHAHRVWLMLFEQAEQDAPAKEVEMIREGDLWRTEMDNWQTTPFYVFRMEGPKLPTGAYDAEQWLLDPYALAVASPRAWNDPDSLEPGHPLKNGRAFPKGVIIEDTFDWGDDRPLCTPLQESVIYEAHLRGFTAHDTSGVEQPGTYRGFMEKIPYLQELGITAVEFLPLSEFNEMEFYIEGGDRQHLHNFWGYSTLAFMAPNARYAATDRCSGQVHEFKELVKALHAAGIEVILDIVFNHTAEGDARWPTLYNFKGIDPPIYYMLGPNRKDYLNFSGCGNTVNCNHPVVQDLILDTLRYWVQHYHIDGFRFDLASVLCRGLDGEPMEQPPVIDRMNRDPILKKTKLIAEPWDAAGLYHVGSFPGRRWSEWNGKYRDDIRGFWNGFIHEPGPLATRIAGSADLYNRARCTPTKSINFITSHDGFTLRDLVSYSEKHNDANGEQNRDGENHNFNVNMGAEGPTDRGDIIEARLRRCKNLLATLFLSQGVPMLTAGDEFGRTQQGNNNAYCQDNDLSWINWSLIDENRDLFEFVKALIAFRRAHPALHRTQFLQGQLHEHEHPDVHWLAPEGKEVDWQHGRSLGMMLHGAGTHTGAEEDGDHILAIFHAEAEPAKYKIPPAPGGLHWQPALKTDDIKVRKRGDKITLNIPGDSVAVFTAGRDS